MANLITPKCLFIAADVDECQIDPGLCENGQCINYNGGFRCDCDMSFAPTEDERACVGRFVFYTFVCL